MFTVERDGEKTRLCIYTHAQYIRGDGTYAAYAKQKINPVGLFWLTFLRQRFCVKNRGFFQLSLLQHLNQRRRSLDTAINWWPSSGRFAGGFLQPPFIQPGDFCWGSHKIWRLVIPIPQQQDSTFATGDFEKWKMPNWCYQNPQSPKMLFSFFHTHYHNWSLAMFFSIRPYRNGALFYQARRHRPKTMKQAQTVISDKLVDLLMAGHKNKHVPHMIPNAYGNAVKIGTMTLPNQQIQEVNHSNETWPSRPSSPGKTQKGYTMQRCQNIEIFVGSI